MVRIAWNSSFIGILIIGVVVGSAFAQQKPKLRPLHIALANHSVSMTAIYVAKHLGIFESYGYDARVLVLEPRAALAALLAGELDFYTAIGSTARAALRGVPVRVGLVALNRSDLCWWQAKRYKASDRSKANSSAATRRRER